MDVRSSEDGLSYPEYMQLTILKLFHHLTSLLERRAVEEATLLVGLEESMELAFDERLHAGIEESESEDEDSVKM